MIFGGIPLGLSGGFPGMGGSAKQSTPPQQRVDGVFGNNRPGEPVMEQGVMGGIRGWLDRARGEGDFAERLGLFGASLMDLEDNGGRADGIRERQDGERAQTAAEQQRAELDALAQSLGMDDREYLLFLADPEAWARANQSRFEAYNMSQGDRRMIGGEEIAYAPEVGISEGFPYRTTSAGGVEFGNQRPLSHAEEIRQAQIAEQQRIAAERLELSRRADARAAQAAARAASRARSGGSGGGSRAPISPSAGIRWD